jgi:Domain of unknown function (DUF4833)
MNFIPLIFAGVQIASALSISKSSNKNEVHYAVEVDDACVPAGASPVHPYWRMFEKSADATETLGAHEERAYGIARQEVDGSAVRIVLRSLRQRPITIRTWRGDQGMCMSEANATIGGSAARLDGIYVKLKFLGVDYVELSGMTPSGVKVRERLSV